MNTTNHGLGSAVDYNTPPPPTKRGLKAWHVILLSVLAVIVACTIGTAILAAGSKPASEPDAIDPLPVQVAPTTSAAKTGTATATAGAPAPPATNAVAVKGKGNAVVPVGARLNGAFTVDYAFGSWCGIAHFLKADGSDGAEFFEMINECASDVNAKASGSTVVHLTNVTMVKVENTQGNWSLTFKPLG